MLLIHLYMQFQDAPPKTLNDQSFEVDVSPDLAITAKWWRIWLMIFNASKTKELAFHYHRSDPELSLIVMNGCSLERLLDMSAH